MKGTVAGRGEIDATNRLSTSGSTCPGLGPGACNGFAAKLCFGPRARSARQVSRQAVDRRGHRKRVWGSQVLWELQAPLLEWTHVKCTRTSCRFRRNEASVRRPRTCRPRCEVIELLWSSVVARWGSGSARNAGSCASLRDATAGSLRRWRARVGPVAARVRAVRAASKVQWPREGNRRGPR